MSTPPTIPKLVLFKLPKYETAKKLEKFLQTVHCPEPSKIKKVAGKTFAELAFEDMTVATTAYGILSGADCSVQWKTVRAAPAAAPGRVVTKSVMDALRPWHALSYDETVVRKRKEGLRAIRRFTPFAPDRLGVWQAPEAERVVYRNKVGLTLSGDRVGFRTGRTADGDQSVDFDPTLVSPNVAAIVAAFESDVLARYPDQCWSIARHSGLWRYLTIRSFGPTPAQTSAILEVSGDDDRLASEEIATATDVLYRHCSSVYLQLNNGGASGVGSAEGLRPLGEPAPLHVTLLDTTFRVSPLSFFQTYLSAAEALYDSIRQRVASLGDDVIVLDLCCGTGTIGLLCASLPNVKHVYGIEIVEAAVEDARHNMALNGLQDKATFIVGPVETALKELLRSGIGRGPGKVVGILDPPRAGVGTSVLSSLRGLSSLDNLLYVACNHKTLGIEGVSLTKPPSKKYPGTPFTIDGGMIFDMFPHTEQFETFVWMSRQREGESAAATADADAKAEASSTASSAKRERTDEVDSADADAVPAKRQAVDAAEEGAPTGEEEQKERQ